VVELQDRLASTLRHESGFFVTTALCLMGLVALPLLIVGGTATVSRSWGRSSEPWTAHVTRFCYALVPLGFGMWLAHHSFHLVTSYEAVLPAALRFLADRGWAGLGTPDWSCAACIPAPGWLLRLEIMFLDVGLLLSLYTAYRIAHSETHRVPS